MFGFGKRKTTTDVEEAVDRFSIYDDVSNVINDWKKNGGTPPQFEGTEAVDIFSMSEEEISDFIKNL